MEDDLLKNLRKLNSDEISILDNDSSIRVFEMLCASLGPEFQKSNSSQKEGLIYSTYLIWKGIRVRIIVPEYLVDEKNGSSFVTEISDLSRESLTLLFYNDKDNYNELQLNWPDNILAVFSADLIALLTQKCTLTQLIDFKIFRVHYHQKSRLETEYDESLFTTFVTASSTVGALIELDEVLSIKRISPSNWVDHPLCDRIYINSEKKEFQVLIGPSASGKTTLALQVGWKAKSNQKPVRYLNLGQIEEPYSFQFSKIISDFFNASSMFFIIDDTQSNPNLAKLFCFIQRILNRAAKDIDIQFMFLSWPEFSLELLALIQDPKAIHICAEQVRNNLIQKYDIGLSSEMVESIVSRFGSDLFLLIESLKYISEKKELPNSNDLAAHFWALWKSRGLTPIESDAKKIILIVCSLGRFDIPINPTFVTTLSFTDAKLINDLVQMQVLRRVMDMVTLGHRSFATLIGDWLTIQNVWGDLETINGPKDIYEVLHSYLRTLPPSKAIDTLRVLHNRSGFKGNVKLSRKSAELIDIWQAFDSVLERIVQQQLIDPTWGNDPSSTMFVIEALSSVGRASEAKKSIDFLRSIWSVDSEGNIALKTDELPTQEDFIKIGERMNEEDQSLALINGLGNVSKAKEIDLDLMHQNWLVGVLLTAEAAYDRSSQQVKQLVAHALKIVLPGGGYYTERVPWISARILIGLASAGITSSYSPEIRKTLDWLLKDRGKGGALSNGLWKSGTGTWNSDLETSSMCTLAVIKSGVDPTDSRLDAVRGFIKSSTQSWTNPSTILDGALAAEAYLSIGGRWDEIVDEVRVLTLKTKGETFWKSVSKHSKETFTQSCRVAQIASHLINIGWTTIRSDLPSIVNAIEVPKAESPTIDIGNNPLGGENKTMPDSFDQSGDSAFKSLAEMTRVTLSELSVVGNYRRYNEKVRTGLRGWCDRIRRPLTQKSNAHENFLIWAPPGSGKSFLVQEIARLLGDNINYVELNLALLSKETFLTELKSNSHKSPEKPLLFLIDEIDSRSEETWPYEEIFPLLDKNINSNDKFIFILIGSSRTGIEGLTSSISSRSKGKDLIDRIPVNNRFIIPPLDNMDKVALVLSHLYQAAKLQGSEVSHVEKLALYYIITNNQLKSPRQIRDLCVASVQRMPIGESYLRYIDVFDRNDTNIHSFWAEHKKIAESLSERFIIITA